MKKSMLLVALVFCLAACGSSEVVREARKTINGDWVLASVEYPQNAGSVNVNLLSDESAGCFENSSWNFISNNNTGTYQLGGTECPEEPRFFTWAVEEAGANEYFLTLKPTDSRQNSNMDNQGFRLVLNDLTQDRMVWEQTIRFEGSPFTIRMNFIKN